MDSSHFDDLTRALVSSLPRRRALSLLAAVGLVFGGGAPRFAATAKHGNKHKGEEQCLGRWLPKCPRGSVRAVSDCSCLCIHGQYHPKCDRCLPDGSCCPGEKRCGNLCVPSDECCSFERTCHKVIKRKGKQKIVTFCVPEDECCPRDRPCASDPDGCCNSIGGELCTQRDGCCDIDMVCDGKSGTECCTENEVCCPGKGCIDKNACCPTSSLGAESVCCPQDTTPCGDECCDQQHYCCGNKRCCPLDATICDPGAASEPAACCRPGSKPCHGTCCSDSPLVLCCDKSNGQTFCFAAGVGCPA